MEVSLNTPSNVMSRGRNGLFSASTAAVEFMPEYKVVTITAQSRRKPDKGYAPLQLSITPAAARRLAHAINESLKEYYK